MIKRRAFLASGGASMLALGSTPLGAQVADDRHYGYPAGTRPFGPEVYRERRQRLMSLMKTGVAVIYGGKPTDRSELLSDPSGDDFAYLTGISDEPGAALILAPGERTHREFLVLPNVDPESDRVEGVRLMMGGELRSRTGFERIMRTGGLGSTLVQIAARARELRYLGPLVHPDSPIPRELELYGKIAARVPGTSIVNSHNLVRSMRIAKEPRELALMQKAIDATGRGLRAGMRAVRPGMTEYQLRDIMEAEFRAAGARGLAFPSIVAAARNGAVLHYTGGDTVLRAGDLVLCDVGAEYDGYASDITRTFPVDGRFSPEQRNVFETVLRAQDAAAATLRAGSVWEDVNKVATNVIEAAGHRDDFWHGLGHFVGLDVHDVGDYAQPLPAGAVLTIEPGIYLPARNFGVRIEDEYLVTATGSQHLSRGIPRTVAEVEAAMGPR